MTEPTESSVPLERIEAALARLGAEHEPPPGWEARVLAATAPPAKRSWWWLGAPALALAAALVIVVIAKDPAKPPALALNVAVTRSPTVTRMSGSDAQLGDTIHATAAGGHAHRAVWIYRSEQLILICPGGATCRSADGGVTADVVLDSIGTYQIVALASDAALPTPTGGFDHDVAAAASVATVSHRELVIR